MADQPKPSRSDWMSKLVVPISVSVIGAILVTALTPLGDNLRELLFPTKAVVSGAVTTNGEGANDARLVLDQKNVDAPVGGGTFLISGVHAGTHVLEVRTVSSKPSVVRFTIERRETTHELGKIDLVPLLQLGFYLNSFDLTSASTQRYDFTLWVIGSRRTVHRIAAVQYVLPSPLPTTPVEVTDAHSNFCYREQGQLAVSFTSSRAPKAVVEFPNGKVFPIFSRQVDQATPPQCRVSKVRGVVSTRGGGNSSGSGNTGGGNTGGGGGNTGGRHSGGGGNNGGGGGHTLITVPSVTGLTYEAAKASLQALGFNVARTEVTAPEPKGTVVKQDPPSKSRQANATTVTLSVSSGPPMLRVPDVTNVDEATAKATLTAAGLKTRVEDEDTADAALDGVVLTQDPAPGTDVGAGAEITIAIGRFITTTT